MSSLIMPILRYIAIGLSILPWPSISAAADSNAYPMVADIMLKNARIISPPKPVMEKGTVLIKGERIIYVGPATPEASAQQTIDLNGKSIIPGLIDTHVHLIIGPNSDQAYDQTVAEQAQPKLREFLSRGVTTLMSVGDYWPQILKVRKMLADGQLIGPRFLITGPLITPTNGHPVDVSECIHNRYCIEHWAGQVDDPESAKKLVDELADAGVDALKVTFTSPSKAKGMLVAGFSAEMLKTVVDEGHARKLRVAVFAQPMKNAIRAVDIGVDWLTHPVYDGIKSLDKNGDAVPTEDYKIFIAKANRRGVGVSTTTGDIMPVVDYWGIKRTAHTGAEYDTDMEYGAPLRELLTLQNANMRFMEKNHVLLAFGTGTFRLQPAIGVATEFAGLAAAGFSAEQSLLMATFNAAIEIGRDKDIGTIEAGKFADIVALTDDPLKSVQALNSVQWVMVAGKIRFQRQTMDSN